MTTPFRPFLRLAAAALACIALIAPAARADEPDIARLAPERSFAVLSVPDFARAHAAFEKSELGKLWAEPSVQRFIEEITREESESFASFLKELGAETKDLKPPTGHVGLAFYFDDKERRRGPRGRLAQPDVHFLGFSDFGEQAGAWKDVLERLVERAEKDKEITTEHEKFGEHEIIILKPVYPDAPAPDDEDADDEDEPEFGDLAGFIGGDKGNPRTMAYCWSGSRFIAGSVQSDLEAALDALAGKDIASLGETPLYRDSLAQHPTGLHGYGVLVAAPFIEMLKAELANDAMPGGPDIAAILDVLGVSNLKSVSFGMRMDNPEWTAETTIGVLVPEKKGLVALLADPLGAFDPPAFVPPDAASVSALSFRFDKLYDLAREVVATFPEDQRAQMSAMLDQGVGIVKPTLDVMGPGIHYFTTYRQPLAADSESTVWVIDARDVGTLANTLSFAAAQSGGMIEPRDFEGNTIFGSDQIPIAAGVGFNRCFIGAPAGVENAMRLAGRADAPRIAGEPAFKEATRNLPSGANSYTYADMRQVIRWAYWTVQNAAKIVAHQFGFDDLDEAERDEFLKDIMDEQPEWMSKLPPLDAILSHVGDSASEVRPTPDGFRGRSLILKPRPN